VWSFVGYSPNSYTRDYEFLKIGAGRADNRGGVTPMKLIALVSYTSSTTAAITQGATVGGEVDAAVAKVRAEYTATASLSVSWTMGTTYQAQSDTPPGMVGYMDVFVPGIYTLGTATYKVLDTSNEKITTVNRGIGVRVPDNMLNFKVRHTYS